MVCAYRLALNRRQNLVPRAGVPTDCRWDSLRLPLGPRQAAEPVLPGAGRNPGWDSLRLPLAPDRRQNLFCPGRGEILAGTACGSPLAPNRRQNLVTRGGEKSWLGRGSRPAPFPYREAAATMAAKSWGFREAPPMRPPSTSGWSSSSAAFLAFMLPPYWMVRAAAASAP